jgi:hypothetical protein
VKPKHVVVASELLGAYRTAQSQITGDPKIWTYGANDAGLARIDEAVAKFDGGRLSETERAKLTIEPRLFIYTSAPPVCRKRRTSAITD